MCANDRPVSDIVLPLFVYLNFTEYHNILFTLWIAFDCLLLLYLSDVCVLYINNFSIAGEFNFDVDYT